MCTYTQQSSRHGKQNDSTVIEPKGKQNYLDTVTREHQLEFNGKSTKHFGHFEFGNLYRNWSHLLYIYNSTAAITIQINHRQFIA